MAAAYAVACFGKYFDDRGVVLQTENEGVAHFAQKLYRRCGVQGTVISKERPTGPVYEFSVKDPDEVAKMLALFGHTGKEPTLRIRPENFKCQNCMQAFIATAFLCCGTMTDPEKSYNLEFLSTRHYLSQQLEAMLAEHNFHPHRALRKGANTIYIKAADHIEDLLTFMGAGGAAMRIMDQRMYNEMRNKTNRLSNCETANISKSVNAAVQVQLAIEKLQAAVDREKDMIEQGKRRERERELKGYPGSNPWPDEEEEKKALEHVTFSMRVYPLLEMLRAAQKKGKKVMWGVP